MILRMTLAAMALLPLLVARTTATHAATDSPIFPPGSYFVLPRYLVGGSTKMVALDSTKTYHTYAVGYNGFVRDTEYKTPLGTYHVMLFETSRDAQQFNAFSCRDCYYCAAFRLLQQYTVTENEWMGDEQKKDRSVLRVGLFHLSVSFGG